MITARLAQKPYLEIPKSAYDQLAKVGKKTVKIAIVAPNGRKGSKQSRKSNRKALLVFADRTLGMWAEDQDIEQAFKELDERWQQWREESLS
ncbi:hypothetical protein HUU05_22400 [candidate division KSB1 bacterium]|nr:hypothetical protein [candidate division KSB1 bacterium]